MSSAPGWWLPIVADLHYESLATWGRANSSNYCQFRSDINSQPGEFSDLRKNVTAWLLGAALQDEAILLTQSLNLSLVSIDNSLVAEILSPLISIAGVVAIGCIALHAATLSPRFAYCSIVILFLQRDSSSGLDQAFEISANTVRPIAINIEHDGRDDDQTGDHALGGLRRAYLRQPGLQHRDNQHPE